MCMEYAKNSQIKLPNKKTMQIDLQFPVTKELAIAQVLLIGVHTAQCMFATFCKLHLMVNAACSIKSCLEALGARGTRGMSLKL